jgi:hypothetical protein
MDARTLQQNESYVGDIQTNESVRVVEDNNIKMGKTGDSPFVPRQREVFRGISKPEEDEITEKIAQR